MMRNDIVICTAYPRKIAKTEDLVKLMKPDQLFMT